MHILAILAKLLHYVPAKQWHPAFWLEGSYRLSWSNSRAVLSEFPEKHLKHVQYKARRLYLITYLFLFCLVAYWSQCVLTHVRRLTSSVLSENRTAKLDLLVSKAERKSIPRKMVVAKIEYLWSPICWSAPPFALILSKRTYCCENKLISQS